MSMFITITSVSCLFLFCFFYYLLVIRPKQMFDRIRNFSYYDALLEKHMEKAYDILYKDRILIYSIEATKLNDDEFRKVAKDFLSLVLTMLGKELTKEFISIYGSEDTFYFNIVEYFNTKFDDDEIRRSAQDSLMNQEIDTEG